MDLTTLNVSDDSSSFNSFVEISSDLSDSELNSESMEKKVECEEEFKTISLKLQESEQEIEKLKSDSMNKESELRAELEIAQRETETARRRVADLETDVGQSYAQISNLNAMLFNCRTNLSNIITNQKRQIDGLLSNKTYLESVVRDMEYQIENSDAVKLELQHEINALKTDLVNRGEDIEALKKECEMQKQSYIEALKKECEMQKQSYDMLMIEKDELLCQNKKDQRKIDDLILMLAAFVVVFIFICCFR